GAMAAITTTINRVNGILKRDVSLELQLVANNEEIVFTNAATDGYSNNDSGKMLDENQTNIDNIIGNDNYDIVHAFSTGNGGVAYLGSVCASGIKAGGVTGSQLPQGDAFDVDYVTHEIGHQLGANHTQNNDCSSTLATSFEPGSGSTIMGYAGICFPNVQTNSDDYFHSISIDQIRGFTTETGDACAIKTPLNNTAPTVSAGADYTIPHSTPFELIGTATDPNNDALTYAWEQMDNAPVQMPPLATSDKGPAFRSLPPVNSPIRQFPSKDATKNHSPSTWEVLPSVGRDMKFRLTVRDNFSGGGNTVNDEMKLTIASNAGSFKVSSPNGGEVLAAGIPHIINWDVAGSNQSPVNCTTVDIFLSVDGGETYPIVLAENVVNNGTEAVSFQNSMITSNARIKIKGHDNVFFDVSDSNFQINQSQSGFNIALSASNLAVCQGEATEIAVDVISLEGFTGLVNLSANLPTALANHTLSANSVNTGSNTTLIISTANTTTPGIYPVTLTGIHGDLVINRTLNITVLPQTPEAVTLITPANQAQEISTMPTFNWSAAGTETNYTFELSEDANFSTLSYSESNLTITEYTLPLNLENGQTYYWRVKTTNQCSANNNASIHNFTVSNNLCQQYRNDNGLIISDGLPSTIASSIIIQESGIVNEVTVRVDIAHSWIGDLTLTLESPTGKRAVILREICGNEDQLKLSFSNNGSGTIPCAPPISENIFAPIESFDIFNGEEINGTWKLLVADGVELDGGTLKSWSLEVCRKIENNEPLNVLISNTSNPNCNGASTGSIQASIVGGAPNYTILWSNGANQLTLNNLNAGSYQVTVTDGNGTRVSASASLVEPAAIAIEDIVQDASCNDMNNGSIQIFPSGGTPTYKYQWANGVRQASNLNLPNGNYSVTVTDGNNCTASKTYTVLEPSPIELSFSSNNALNGQNGSVDLAVTGGTGEYSYTWSSGATTRDVDGLAPGNFVVTVTDANNCAATGEINVVTENTGQECYSVTINITLDNYGTENRWELKDGNGELIQAVGPFNNFENGAVKATTLCLPPGCYDFTIFDLWGDGMCCAYGQGGYEVIEDATGKVIASGGSYNKQESKTICLPAQVAGLSVINYCGANGRNTQYEWIETVEIAGQVFNSGDNEGYGDFTETVIDVPVGGVLDLAFTPGFGFFEYHENWQIWIDFNKDGDFDDEGEAIFLTSGNNRLEGTIGIPTNAATGNVRMRIAMKWGELVGPCESFSWGEVEDYTLNLQGEATLGERQATAVFNTGKPAIYTTQERNNQFELTLFPNPSSDYIHLEWADNQERFFDLSIYNSLGQLQNHQQVATQKGANKVKIDLTQLSEGLYLLHLRNKDKLITKEFVVIK
ncbi:MAG: zinc-dependent metalloprotease family protein, partial [Saprospiraceae bacterium]